MNCTGEPSCNCESCNTLRDVVTWAEGAIRGAACAFCSPRASDELLAPLREHMRTCETHPLSAALRDEDAAVRRANRVAARVADLEVEIGATLNRLQEAQANLGRMARVANALLRELDAQGCVAPEDEASAVEVAHERGWTREDFGT